jgi:acetyl esterase/lipase
MKDGSTFWGAHLPDPDETVRLWPGAAPGKAPKLQFRLIERSTNPAFKDRAVIGISEPLFTVFRPQSPNGAAVLIATGGNYIRVVLDKEGFETARRVNEAGITAFVLRYRLPFEGWQPEAPLQDAQRALRLIRADAPAYGIDPARLGIMGFSAGGHVAASLATCHGQRVYDPVDAADAVSARPDFQALFYPVITMLKPHAFEGAVEAVLGKDAPEDRRAAFSRERFVDGETPPAFLCTATNDDVIPATNTRLYEAALVRAGISAELHWFENGGHGFGIRVGGNSPVSIWPELFLNWARARGITRG